MLRLCGRMRARRKLCDKPRMPSQEPPAQNDAPPRRKRLSGNSPPCAAKQGRRLRCEPGSSWTCATLRKPRLPPPARFLILVKRDESLLPRAERSSRNRKARHSRRHSFWIPK